jgi:oxygen-independent coproporphyrinogen-3 oxidase
MKAVYIHIPFCHNICHYCDFCKLYYDKKMVEQYLKALEREIREVYKGDAIKTLYIGGGTPSSLEMEEFKSTL